MEIYDKLIENPLFFKWLFYPSAELEAYWQAYLEQNHSDSERIIEFRALFEKHLKYNNVQLSETGRKELAHRIIKQMELQDHKKRQGFVLRSILKYAAVAVLFLTIGSSLVYLYKNDRQENSVSDNLIIPADIKEPILIIDGKKQIQLNQGQSELDYSAKNKLAINNEKVLTRESAGKTPEINNLIIPFGSRSLITLSDSSRVWLNAGSQLIYPSEFIDKTREVFLVGEAFFEVKQNLDKPFVVKTNEVEINVLGTRFNVSCYPEDYSVQTVLAEGSVKIKRANADSSEKELKLLPGQMAYFNKKNKETSVMDIDVEQYVLWIEGLFCFNNTDFNRIAMKLERYYNIRFSIDDPMKGTIQISGKLDVSKGKDKVFEYLGTITGLEFVKIDDNKYSIK